MKTKNENIVTKHRIDQNAILSKIRIFFEKESFIPLIQDFYETPLTRRALTEKIDTYIHTTRILHIT